MRRLAVLLAFFAGLIGPAVLMAQAPAPVPALPDTERRTTYTITGSNCNCPIGFDLYGDATDYGAWIAVYLDGVLVDPSTYSVTSSSGPLATRPRPITDGQLSFNALTTGEVQIVGGRRPRRTHLFAENRGVAARDLNQIANDIEAQNREAWDLRNRSLIAPPGTVFGPLPAPATCAGAVIGFDDTGLNPICSTLAELSSAVNIAPGTVSNSMLANMDPLTVKCNPTGVAATPQDCNSDTVTPLVSTFSLGLSGAVPPPGLTTVSTQVYLRGDGTWVSTMSPSPPILTLLTSGSAGIFSPSPGTLYMSVEICGGGGGGGATGTPTAGLASPGSRSFFGSSATALFLAGNGGTAGTSASTTVVGEGGVGGLASQGDINLKGGQGSYGTGLPHANNGGAGAGSSFGGGGAGGAGYGNFNDNRGLAAESLCAGGGGSGSSGTVLSGGGGGAGGYLEKLITQPISSSYAYESGLGGAGGDPGPSGAKGGRGGNGVVIIQMFFQ